MDPRTGEAEQHLPRRDLVAGQLRATLDRADAEAGKVVVAVGIHAGHFGSLAADQRAAGRFAALGDARNHALRNPAFELAGGEIIEEKQRFGALHDQIIDAHRDEVDADAVVPVVVDRQLELGSDPVIGRDQQRIGIARRLRIEESPEAAQLAVGTGAGGRLDQRPDRLDQRVSGLDRHPRLGVGVALARLFIPRHIHGFSQSVLDFHA